MNPRRPSVRKKPTRAGEPPTQSAEPDRKLETFYHVAIGCFVAHLELKLGYEVHKHGIVTEWPVLELSVSGSRQEPLTLDDIDQDLHDDVLSVPTEDGGLTVAQVSVSVQKEATFAKVSVRFADGARSDASSHGTAWTPATPTLVLPWDLTKQHLKFIVDTAIGLDHFQRNSAAEDAFVAWYEKRYSGPLALSERELSALGKSYQAVFGFFKKWLEPDNLRTPFIYPPAPEPPSRQEEADDHESPLSGRAHSSSDRSKHYPDLKPMHGTTGVLYLYDKKTGETFEADRYGNPVLTHVPHAHTW
ncbi:hypothetical protein Rhopal_000409-T1 [Rhodotorula paludigena]|uniref:Uncharacterized protein n=1 Tax=Rhodotorula paludigena TaxID=86838 RepID=A0AAV5GCH9_9BASI|nr:hypothetical protein Rhopal_000409-T1 [Rhodotorula paludigena]